MQRLATEIIVVHCSYTPVTMDIGAADIRRWHLERGWSDCGYHFVIRRDGRLEEGRPFHQVGAHARGYNAISIGVCLVGGKDEFGPVENYTEQQFTTLTTVLKLLSAEFPKADIVGHCDLPGVTKSCPVFDVAEFWEQAR